MANSKISALTSATTPLAGTETLPIVQSGATKQVSVANLTAGRAVSASSMTLTTALAATSGGTGSTSAFTSNGIVYANSITTLTTGTGLQFDGTNVGIGGASTGAPASSRVIESPSNNLVLATGAGSATNIYANVKFTGVGGTTQYASNFYALIYSQSIGTGEHRWYTAPAGTTGAAPTFTQRLTLEPANGNLTANTGNVVIGTSGKGIDFSAVVHSGSTSKLLADYEEGTFTPTVIGTTTTGTGTYTAQVGRYTKIGNRVNYAIYLNWTAHTGTGNMRVTGLPFTSNSTANNLTTPAVWQNNISLSLASVLTLLLAASSTTIILYQYGTGGGAVNTVTLDTAGELAITGTYEV